MRETKAVFQIVSKQNPYDPKDELPYAAIGAYAGGPMSLDFIIQASIGLCVWFVAIAKENGQEEGCIKNLQREMLSFWEDDKNIRKMVAQSFTDITESYDPN